MLGCLGRTQSVNLVRDWFRCIRCGKPFYMLQRETNGFSLSGLECPHCHRICAEYEMEWTGQEQFPFPDGVLAVYSEKTKGAWI